MSESEIVRVDENGRVNLPECLIRKLLKHIGCRSKKRRVQNKLIKKAFLKALKSRMENYESSSN